MDQEKLKEELLKLKEHDLIARVEKRALVADVSTHQGKVRVTLTSGNYEAEFVGEGDTLLEAYIWAWIVMTTATGEDPTKILEQS